MTPHLFVLTQYNKQPETINVDLAVRQLCAGVAGEGTFRVSCKNKVHLRQLEIHIKLSQFMKRSKVKKENKIKKLTHAGPLIKRQSVFKRMMSGRGIPIHY